MTIKISLIALLASVALPGQVGVSAAQAGGIVERKTLTDAEINDRANSLIARMTPAEKAGQLFVFTGFAVPPAVDPNVAGEISSGRVGGYFLASDPAYINGLQRLAVEKSRLGIPLLFGLDAIHGTRTIFPVPIGLAASWDIEMVERVMSATAEEARAAGVTWVYGPNVDIARDPRWGRMVEGPGADPYLASAMAAAQVRGLQGPYLGSPGHVMATVKHFAGYGAPQGGRDYDEVELSDNMLWNVYLPPFKAAVDAGVGSVMSAYMPLNGVPAAANRWLLTDVLRNDWHFGGLLVSDAVSVTSLVTQGVAADKPEAARLALGAGVDVELGLPSGALNLSGPNAPGGSAYASLPKAVADGQVSEARLDAAVKTVLTAKLRLGLFEKPYADPKALAKAIKDPKHRELARISAERSAVLLRNDKKLLPLDPAKIRSLAVVGPLADSAVDTEGPWVFEPRSTSVTILEGLRNAVGSRVAVNYVEGVQIPPRLNPRLTDPPQPPLPPMDEDAGIARAVAAANRADATIVVVGEKLEMSGENASRATLDLPGRQQELVNAVTATGKPVILLVMSGRPLDLKNTTASAIMMIWYPGSEGGNAVADLMFGKASPGGRLPFDWPRSVGQIPSIYSQLSSHDPTGATKRYWDAVGGPEWRFGFGLSYSQFEYSNLNMSAHAITAGQSVTVSAAVRNVGTRTADDVVQLYLHQRNAAARPVRELKGFQRVTLAPGTSTDVTFRISPEDLKYWSQAKHAWVQDPSAFDLWVGGSSSASLSGQFSVTTGASLP